MERRSLHLETGGALVSLSFFAITLFDLWRNFAVLSLETTVALLASSVIASWFCLRNRFPHRFAGGLLLAAATISLAIRAFGYEPTTRHTTEEWNQILRAEAEGFAATARAQFEELCSMTLAEARTLGRDPRLRTAVETSDPAAIAEAFSVLLALDSLPRAHPSGAPGVVLFDSDLRPVAWSGSSGALEWLSSRRRTVSDAELAVLDTGATTSIVALQPLEGGVGFVSVEVPLAADRRLENRYLRDFDALSSLVGRTIETRFPSSSAQTELLQLTLDVEGDPYWRTERDSPRLYFSLPGSDGSPLGLGSIAVETVAAARDEHRRRFALVSAIVLVLGSVLALVAIASRSPTPLAMVATIWGFRLVLRLTNIPLGLGLDLDNPAHYASSLFFGLARSPLDFLLTALAILASGWLLAGAFRARTHDADLPPLLVRALVAPSALSLFVGVNEVVQDSWLNSNLALSEISFSLADLPRLTVQLGLVAIFTSVVWVAVRALSWARGPLAGALAWDVVIASTLFLALKSHGLGEHLVLSIVSLSFVHVLALGRGRIERFFTRRRLHFRIPAVILFGIVGVISFYPSVALFESSTVRGFIETTVTPVVLNHRRARTSTLIETARTIDRMYEEGRLGDLGREDLAFRIWVSTDLSVSSLSSAVEVVDPARRVVSRFALSFPAITPEEDAAPEVWIPEERTMPGDSVHPGFVTARRSFEGPDQSRWEIRVRLAADWRNLPFIATTDPYLDLFRSMAAETPLRFPHQELELIVLSNEGDMVFQSVGGSLSPGEQILKKARETPVWWEHPHEGQIHRTYLVGDGEYVYTLSYPEKSLLTQVAQLARWVLLAGAWGGLGFILGLALGALRVPFGIPPWELFHGIGSSFSAKLYIAFVLIALVPIVFLAFLMRGIVVRELEQDVEREGVDRAEVAARIVREVHFSQPTSAVGVAPLTDAVLERVRALAGVDVDIHVGGELLATSKPELVASGLVPTRAAPTAHRDIVIDRQPYSVHRESVGSFRYLVVSAPIVLPPWSEPGILSLPLASRQAEINRKVASLNQAVLLAAIGFSLIAAALAYSLAHRIAGPINELTEATRAVAEGSLDLSLDARSPDEIGALFASFNQMTADLKRQRKDLERTKKLEAWAEMARQVAHEVKNPLTPIQLSTEHLVRVYGDADVDFEKVLRECSETILQQVKALRQISMEFSTFASPEPLNLQSTDLEGLLRETIEPYRKSPPEGVSLRIEVGAGVPRILADSRLLQRTIVNLLENALQAVNGNGTIEVKLSTTVQHGEAFVEVTVSDDGVGIDPELKARVFEPYFSTRAAGTGLGLAIARKVVEDHHGEVSLESEPGKGTRVTLRLPVPS